MRSKVKLPPATASAIVALHGDRRQFARVVRGTASAAPVHLGVVTEPVGVWVVHHDVLPALDTVPIDQETVYAPRQGNDRLLLGFKGSLNEYELDLLRHRSLSARYEKARPANSSSLPRSASRSRFPFLEASSAA
jgi:hypothetical protein